MYLVSNAGNWSPGDYNGGVSHISAEMRSVAHWQVYKHTESKRGFSSVFASWHARRYKHPPVCAFIYVYAPIFPLNCIFSIHNASIILLKWLTLVFEGWYHYQYFYIYYKMIGILHDTSRGTLKSYPHVSNKYSIQSHPKLDNTSTLWVYAQWPHCFILICICHLLVVNTVDSPSLSVFSCSECSVAVYAVSGFRLRRVYWVRRAGRRSCLGLEPSTVRKRR